MNDRPIHRIKPTRSFVIYTWCGVDPARKGIRIEGWHDPADTRKTGHAVKCGTATCRDCLRLSTMAGPGPASISRNTKKNPPKGG